MGTRACVRVENRIGNAYEGNDFATQVLGQTILLITLIKTMKGQV